ncbi:MAG: CinA family protein [Planctomycetaceae bacterium]
MADESLLRSAEQLAERLRQTGSKAVFAESCTGGLVAAVLARIPGISDHLCGSAVVYRNATKAEWLGVSADDLANASIGPVSEEVAAAMAIGVLERTPEADLAASVTGHLGPDAPPDLDGVIYVGIALRESASRSVRIERILRHVLTSAEDGQNSAIPVRHVRHCRAAEFVLQSAAAVLSGSG